MIYFFDNSRDTRVLIENLESIINKIYFPGNPTILFLFHTPSLFVSPNNKVILRGYLAPDLGRKLISGLVPKASERTIYRVLEKYGLKVHRSKSKAPSERKTVRICC